LLEKDLLLLFFFDFDLGLLLVADLAPAQRGHHVGDVQLLLMPSSDELE